MENLRLRIKNLTKLHRCDCGYKTTRSWNMKRHLANGVNKHPSHEPRLLELLGLLPIEKED